MSCLLGYHVGSYFVGQYYSAASTMIRIDANAKETASEMLVMRLTVYCFLSVC